MRLVTSKGLEEKPKDSKMFSVLKPVREPFLKDSITELLNCSPDSMYYINSSSINHLINRIYNTSASKLYI